MPDDTLEALMGQLARLLSPRSSTPRHEALRNAHREIRRFAEVQHLSEAWCDRVLLEFIVPFAKAA